MPQLTATQMQAMMGLRSAPNLTSVGTNITLNGNSNFGFSSNVVTGQNWLDPMNIVSSPNIKKYEVVETTEDIVALSTTAHRISTEHKIYHKLTDHELFERVTQPDREYALKVKDYYSKKIMMWKLKGTSKLSPFREDMNKLVHSDGKTFKESMIGIAYWLPKFYEYDTEMDLIKTQLNTNQGFEKLDKEGKPKVLKLSCELTPISKTYRISKRSKKTEYWFKDSNLDAGVVVTIEDKNQLQHLWDYMYDNEKSLKIKGSYVRRKLDDFEYFNVTNWELDRS